MTEFQLSPVENNGKRVLTTAQLAEAYGTTVDTINRNFNRNKDRFIEGKHFYRLIGEDLKNFASDNLSGANSNKIRELYLWTEMGSLLHAKSLNTDKAWEAYDYLLEHYFRTREITTAPDYSALSPQLQFMIQMEQRQNKLETAVQDTNRRLDGMCEAMQVRGTNWRKATHSLINRIAKVSHTDPSELYIDIYEEIEYRAGVKLSVRLDNMINRLYERGASDSRINRLNKIDVIAEDKKLIEIYIAVVKEMAVKYKAC